MQKLVEGIHQFQSTVVRPQREWFERLAGGQRPPALFVTCSDSRVNPNLITQTDPGELFIVRNAGNIVPAVAAGLAKGELKLHGWVYKIETGEVFAFDPQTGQFAPLADQQPPPVPALRLTAPAI